MKLKLILFLMLLLSIVSVANADYVSSCYQEYANESSCFNSNNGTYQCFGSFQTGKECKYFYDGIWTLSSYAKALATNPTNIKVEMNYYLPVNRTILNVKWQVRFLNKSLSNPYYNFTLPFGCINNSYADVFTEVNGSMIYFICHNYNNDTDIILYNETGVQLNSRNIIEEGMNWNLSCVNTWNCNGYSSCLINNTQNCNSTIDLNSCGNNYTGDYSEFTPQSCLYPVLPLQPNFNPVLALFYIISIMSLGSLFIVYRFTILKTGTISMVEFVVECSLIVLGILIVSILLSG